METKMIFLPMDQLTSEIKNAIAESFKKHEEEKQRKENEKLYYINQVAKKLGKSHATIKKLCKAGLIKTTKSGLITDQAINDYLQNT